MQKRTQRRRQSCSIIVLQEPDTSNTVSFANFPEIAFDTYMSLASKRVHSPSYQTMATLLQARFPDQAEEVLELLPSLMRVFIKKHEVSKPYSWRRSWWSRCCCSFKRKQKVFV